MNRVAKITGFIDETSGRQRGLVQRIEYKTSIYNRAVHDLANNVQHQSQTGPGRPASSLARRLRPDEPQKYDSAQRKTLASVSRRPWGEDFCALGSLLKYPPTRDYTRFMEPI